MRFAFEIRASNQATAKKAVEQKLQSCDIAPEDSQRALTMVGGFVDALDATKEQDYLVVVNGSDRAEDGKRQDLSFGCSVYLVPKLEEPQPEPQPEAKPQAKAPQAKSAAAPAAPAAEASEG